MKTVALTLTVVTIVVMLLISIPLSIKTVEAANGDYSIERVNHTIKILYNGYIIISDTIRVTGQISDPFFMGFPFKYGPHVLQSVAYNESDVFPISLDVPLENHIGFYGVKIEFPRGTPQLFTVGFLLSNNLLTQYTLNTSYYLLDFPAYPSFTKPADLCESSILLEGATYRGGTVEGLVYQRQDLPEFTYAPADVTFLLTGDTLRLIDVKELKREIIVNEVGDIVGLDSYLVLNKGFSQPTSFEVILPRNASNPKAEDQFGRTLSGSLFKDEKAGRYLVSFTLSLRTNESTRFTVEYSLPSQMYINAQGTTNILNFTSLQFQSVNYYVGQTSITFLLPEGARILTYGNYSITESVFQESLIISLGEISPLGGLSASADTLQFTYEYNPLWLAFRPTLWMWAIAIIGCSVFMVWKRPKAPERIRTMPVTVTARLRPEDIKSFTSAYEEKRRMTLSIESLENKAQKGKIPRRRYKVQRKTLETRLNSLSRTISETREKMRAAGSQYAELTRQLETAEMEIGEVETNIKSIEARHSRGELPLEAYRKLLADYERRKEKANTTIDGILLRLREESR